jgi:hypothetical protein
MVGLRRYRMHAVVARSTLHDFEKARSFLKEEGIPRISQAPGFVSAQWVRLDDTCLLYNLTLPTN